MNTLNNNLLFSPRILPSLSELRGKVWQDLINKIIAAGPDSIDQMAFILMMSHINNCASCNIDSFRSMNGCTACSVQSLKRSREADDGLVKLYMSATLEVEKYLDREERISLPR